MSPRSRLGLGTFESASAVMLDLLGVGIETALAATLLLRGSTFWMPMLPGVWPARREIGGNGRETDVASRCRSADLSAARSRAIDCPDALFHFIK